MVLDDVADDPVAVEVSPSALGAEILLEGDLDIGDMIAIPKGLKDGVGIAHHHEVLDHFLSEVVIDAIEMLLRVQRAHGTAELLEAGGILPERFLNNEAIPSDVMLSRARAISSVTAIPLLLLLLRRSNNGILQAGADGNKHAGRDGEVEQPVDERGAGRGLHGPHVVECGGDAGLAVVRPGPVDAAVQKRRPVLVVAAP
mmetsp:Transcript_10470/g.17338  ORF Transcript_10470/g.17338 Transcript_10470/m.17338 type:complete len:200 (-) Transcript_10470:309-908(-)